MVKVAVVGATGYAGEELLKILVNHPQVKITSVSAKIDQAQKIGEIFPELSGKLDLVCAPPELAQIAANCDLVFLALPHRVSMQMAAQFLQAGKKVIDLSADYRLKDKSLYQQWYGVQHQSPEYLKDAVYGLPEVYRKAIKPAKLIANPGCYPTGAILACLPLLTQGVVNSKNIIIDAKSGLSGAGREKQAQLKQKSRDNFMAYKVDNHQHSPEINQELSNFAQSKIKVTFVPHLIPIQRGILSTVYLQLTKTIDQNKAQKLYQDFYQNEPFVQVLPEGEFAQLKDVAKTNFCHLAVKINSAKKQAIVISAIDNLIKGASGQAVQNMNIMYGFKETAGLQ